MAFLPLFFICSFFKCLCGKRIEMGYRTSMVAGLVVSTSVRPVMS